MKISSIEIYPCLNYEFIRLFSLVINSNGYNNNKGCVALYFPVLSISPFPKLHSSEKQFSHITGDWAEYKVVYNDLCEWCRPGFELCSPFTFGESIWTTSVYYSEFFAALENDSVSETRLENKEISQKETLINIVTSSILQVHCRKLHSTDFHFQLPTRITEHLVMIRACLNWW